MFLVKRHIQGLCGWEATALKIMERISLKILFLQLQLIYIAQDGGRGGVEGFASFEESNPTILQSAGDQLQLLCFVTVKTSLNTGKQQWVTLKSKTLNQLRFRKGNQDSVPRLSAPRFMFNFSIQTTMQPYVKSTLVISNQPTIVVSRCNLLWVKSHPIESMAKLLLTSLGLGFHPLALCLFMC